MNTPCKDCLKRHTYCHVKCDAYNEFAKERRKINDSRNAVNMMLEYQRDAKTRMIKRRKST